MVNLLFQYSNTYIIEYSGCILYPFNEEPYRILLTQIKTFETLNCSPA